MRVPRRAVSPLPENHTWANFMKPSFSPEWHASTRVLSAKDGAVTQHGRSVPERERGITNSDFAFLGGSCCVCLFCGLSKTTSVQEELAVEQESRRLVGKHVLSLPSLSSGVLPIDVYAGDQGKGRGLANSEFPSSNRSCQMNSEQLCPAGRISMSLCHNWVLRWHKSTALSHLNVFHFSSIV